MSDENLGKGTDKPLENYEEHTEALVDSKPGLEELIAAGRDRLARLKEKRESGE